MIGLDVLALAHGRSQQAHEGRDERMVRQRNRLNGGGFPWKPLSIYVNKISWSGGPVSDRLKPALTMEMGIKLFAKILLGSGMGIDPTSGPTLINFNVPPFCRAVKWLAK